MSIEYDKNFLGMLIENIRGPSYENPIMFCDRVIFTSVSDGVFRCIFEMNVLSEVLPGNAVHGETNVWYKYNFDGELSYPNEEITTVSDFNFTVTTNDSDITQFEPFIKHFAIFFKKENYFYDSELYSDLSKNGYPYGTRNYYKKKLKYLTSGYDKKYNFRSNYFKHVKNNTLNKVDCFIYKLANNGMHIRYASPIAKTIYNAMYKIHIYEKKPCPHMAMRKKKK